MNGDSAATDGTDERMSGHEYQEDTMREKIRKVAALAAAVATFGMVAALPASSYAAVAGNLPASVKAATPAEKIGCYRLGEAGYTWYPFCAGPYWLYPHHRVCHHGHCWYR